MRLNYHNVAAWLLGGSLLLFTASCRKAADGDAAPPRTPQAAATQLQQVFANAPAEARQVANVATEAMRTENYEKAVQSLEAIKARQNLSFEQGMAVHHSMVALENRLMTAAAAGDANAKRAYERLRQSHRN